MADKNQLKIADQVDLADDDPFAELTRIMGFDPRQPVRPAAAASAVPVVPEETFHEGAAEDDFSLDLEKELLGNFDLEEEQTAPVESPVAEQPVESQEAETPEVDFDFSTAFDEAIAEAPMDAIATADEPAFDGDLDRAFAAAAVENESDGIGDEGFDIGLTDEDMGGLDETPPLPVTPEAVAAADEIGADLDAAMADFLAEAPSAEADEISLEAPAPDEITADAFEADDFGPGLFDESDFRIEDDEPTSEEPSPAELPFSVTEAHPDAQPEIDESAFSFDDSFRLDENSFRPNGEPADDQPVAAQEPAEEFSFDGIDFDYEQEASEPVLGEAEIPASEEPIEEPPVVAESGLSGAPEPISTSNFTLSVPPYVPRKLPTSPMDIAAEEFRQREAAAEPEFNLEDELNALLGNAKTSQTSVDADTSAAHISVDEPSMPEAPAYESPSVSEAYQPRPSNVFGSAAQSDPKWSYGAPEPLGFEAPEHPADIHDDLSWELDEAFASEPAPESTEEDAQEAYAHSDETGEYAGDGQFDAYAEHEEAESAYSFEAEEEPAPIELDEDFADGLDNDHPSESPYRDALAGAIGAAAVGYGSSFAQRPFQASAAARGSEAGSFSPHRDPVVRGNPLKEDPLDVITQLAEKYSRKDPVTPYGRAMSVASGVAAAHQPADETVGDLDISDAFEEPEMETVEVGEQAIALADDLDIPDLPAEEEFPPVAAYDDLDAEFSSLINEMNAESQAGRPANGLGDTLAGGFSARPYENNVVATPVGARPAPPGSYGDEPEPAPHALDADDLPGSRIPADALYAADYEFDPDFDQEIASEHLAGEDRRKPKTRGLLVAGLIGGVALIGGIGAFALSFGGGESTPAIVRADEGPVKVRPENPGGTTVPNQDSKVYETVAGERSPTDAPQQEKLVTTAEEPMDVVPPAVEDEQATASGKSEDRIEQIVQEAENQTDDQIAAIAPRKVRTLVVKPDGTLVPREDEPEAASDEQTEAVAAATPEAAPAAPIPEATGALPSAAADNNPSPALAPPPEEAQDVASPPPAPQQAADEAQVDSDVAAAMPETVPIVPLRPADQPIDVVGEVKPDQVAAATTAAAGSGWAMQIASQPSEAAAQSSYQNLASRYGGVLEGREVNIVKAEIPGKGTFWRVRVPAESRNEAISLCENYKSAGGNCFVSR